MSFGEVIGQDRTTAFLKRVMAGDKIPHAYLFTGIPGIGRTTTARAMAKALNCRRPRDGDGCGECPVCRQIKGGNSPDFLVIRPESESQHIRIQQIRGVLHRALDYAPVEKWRIGVIYEAEKMTDAAANAFLKTLEEPPPGNILILITTESLDLLPTLVSRCQRVPFYPLPSGQIKQWLINHRGVAEDTAQVIARICGGSLGTGLEMLGGDFLEVRQEWLLTLIRLSGLSKTETVDLAIRYADQYKSGESSPAGARGSRITRLLGVWESWYRDLLMTRTECGSELLINADFSQQLKNYAKNFKIDNLISCLLALEQAEQDLQRNRNIRLVMSHAMLALHRFGPAS